MKSPSARRRPARFYILLSVALASPAVAQVDLPIDPATAPPGYQAPLLDPATQLNQSLNLLAADPESVTALLGAGRASLAVGDPNAAVGFFGRADAIQTNSGPIKAALGAALVQMEQPREALRLFARAAELGVPEAEIAADRGLAYDLRGNGKQAAAQYRLALLAHPGDPETTRRLALSLAMAGDRAGALALLDPLLRRQDKAGWRASVFVLALTGDAAAAQTRAAQLLPRNQAALIAPYLSRLGGLKPAEMAEAVHFGRLPGDGHAPRPPMQVASAAPLPSSSAGRALVPSGVPFGTAVSARSVVPSVAGAPIAASESVPAVPAGDRSGTVAPAPAPAALAARTNPAVAAPGFTGASLPGAATPPASAASASATTTTAAARDTGQRLTPTFAAPWAQSPSVPAPTWGRRASARDVGNAASSTPVRASVVRSTAPVVLALASPIVPPPLLSPAAPSVTPVLPGPPPAAASLPPVVPSSGDAGTAPSPGFGSLVQAAPAPASTAPSRVAVADIPPATSPAAQSSAAPARVTLRPSPATGSTPEASRATTSQTRTAQGAASAPRASASAGATKTPEASAGIASSANDDALATAAKPRRGSSATIDGPASVKTAKAGKSATADVRDSAGATDMASTRARGKAGTKSARAGEADDDVAPSSRAARSKSASRDDFDTRTAKADAKGAKAAAKDAKDMKASVAKAAARKEPERYWVQVAGGANKATLPKAYAAVRAAHPAELKGRGAWTTPLRFTNRVLVGPFKSADEAQAFVNKAGKSGLPAFTFTSPPGQPVEKLPAE